MNKKLKTFLMVLCIILILVFTACACITIEIQGFALKEFSYAIITQCCIGIFLLLLY